MRRALKFIAGFLLMVVIGLPPLLWWLIGTESGNAAVISWVAPVIGAEIQIGERQGSVAGALEWRDVVFEDDSVRVELQRLVLNWQPTRLWDRRLKLDELLAEGLVVRLKDKPDKDKPPSDKPPLSRLPVDIELNKLGVRDVQVWLVGAENPIEITRADAVAYWRGDNVRIKSLDLDAPQSGIVQLQAEARLSDRGVSIKRFSLLAPVLVTAQGFVGYEVASDLELAWRDLRWPLPGVLGAPADVAPIITSAKGSTTLKGPWTDLRFALAAALGERTQIKLDGRWNGQLDARAQWTDLTWPLAPGSPPPPWQSARGSLSFKGLPAAYGFDLDADLVAREKAGHVQAQGSGTPQSVDLKLLKLTAGQALVEAAGPLTWAPQPGGALRGQLRRFDPSLFVAGWPGDINGDFAIEGTQAKDAEPALQFEFKLHDSRLRNYPLKLDTQGRYADKILQIDSLELHSGDSVLTASGRATEPYDIEAQLVSLNMAELAPALTGSLQAKLHFQGALAKPKIEAEADLARASWKDYALTSLQLKTQFDWNGPLSLDLSVRDLMAGTRVKQLDVTASGSRTQHRLALKATTEALDADLVLNGGYDERGKRWQGELAQADLTPSPTQTQLAPWRLETPAALLLSARQNELSPACWLSPPGRVCLDAKQTPQLTKASVQLENLLLASLQGFLPANLKLEGSLSGQASAELANGKLRKAQAELQTTAGAAQIGDRRFVFKPAQLSVSDAPDAGHLVLRLPLDVGGVEADARFAPGSVLTQRALSGELRLDFPDLAFLSVLSSEVSSASGRLSGRYTLAGRVGAPELQGDARLSDGRIKLTRPGIELTELNARVSGQPGGKVSVEADARSGEGRLRIEGEVENRPGSASAAPLTATPVAAAPTADPSLPTTGAAPAEPPPLVVAPSGQGGLKVALTVRGEDFLVADLPVARVWVSPDLRFDLVGKAATLKGTLTVPRAEIRLKQGKDDGVGPSSDQVIVNAAGEKPAPVESIKIATEVKLALGRRVSLEGYGLKTRLEGEVTAVDQPGRDTLGYGELRLEDGRYTAYGQDLQIETGKLLFNGGPIAKPGLEIRAVRRPTEEVKVGIYVRGTLERPVLTLYSEPVMTQQEQLSWLLLGQPLDQSSSSQDRGALNGAAVALGLGGGSFLAQNFQKGLGLDQISLGSAPGETNEQARLTVGKYLSPKIFVSYGVGLFEPGQVFKLLYDLGRGFKLSTESGTFTGGDLLYSVERR